MSKAKKYVYVILGLLSFAIGAVGVVVPVLLTTPFLILASYCFARRSEKFDRWFKVNKDLKEKSMTMKQKVRLLLFVNAMLMVPMILIDSLHMRLFLIGLICVKLYYFIFKIKTIKPTNFSA